MDARAFHAMALGYRVNALACTAQAVLETGRFSSIPMSIHRNYWGIKCTRRWIRSGGGCFDARTWEDTKLGAETRVCGFASYRSNEEAFKAYEDLINRLYPVCRDNPDNVWMFLSGLAGKWATDKKYLPKLSKLVLDIGPGLGYSRESLITAFNIAIERGLMGDKLKAIGEWMRSIWSP